MSEIPDVAVVVVTYFSDDVIDSFLDSLALATSATLDIVLADNGSTDGSIERAATRPGVRVVATGANLGYGGAANVGVATTNSEFVVVANPDLVWRSGSLDRLLDAAQRWPEAGSWGPLIFTADGDVYPSARELPSLGRGVGHALLGWWWPTNPWTASYRREQRAPAEGPAGWLSGSCLLLRRKAFDAVDGFDRSYFMYFEDVDLGDRLGQAGWQNVYVPDAIVEHSGGHATGRDHSRMLAEHHRSAERYLARRYAGLRWLPVRAAIRVGLAARSWIALRSSRVAAGAAPARRGATRDEPSAAMKPSGDETQRR